VGERRGREVVRVGGSRACTEAPVACPGARAGESERGDHVTFRVLSASSWLGTLSIVISSEKGVPKTR
jgi:hypothetical protein